MSVGGAGPEQLPRGERLPLGEDDQGHAWVIFAGSLLFLLGVLNFIEGIAAISGSHFFASRARYIFGDLTAWGWVVMLIGLAQGATGFGVLFKYRSARRLGVAFAFLNAIAQLLFIPAYPLWSLSMFALDVLVMYGLVVYGGGRFP